MADLINPSYTEQKTLAQIRAHFSNNKELPSISLQQFFAPDIYAAVKKEMAGLAYRKETNMLQHRFKKATLSRSLHALFEHPEMVSFIASVLGKKTKGVDMAACVFGWKDYTLLHDEATEKPGIDVFFDCTDEWHEGWGGSLVYVDGTGNYTFLPPSPNTFVLVERKKGVQKFVQYVNHHAGKKTRIFVQGIF